MELIGTGNDLVNTIWFPVSNKIGASINSAGNFGPESVLNRKTLLISAVFFQQPRNNLNILLGKTHFQHQRYTENVYLTILLAQNGINVN